MGVHYGIQNHRRVCKLRSLRRGMPGKRNIRSRIGTRNRRGGMRGLRFLRKRLPDRSDHSGITKKTARGIARDDAIPRAGTDRTACIFSCRLSEAVSAATRSKPRSYAVFICTFLYRNHKHAAAPKRLYSGCRFFTLRQ